MYMCHCTCTCIVTYMYLVNLDPSESFYLLSDANQEDKELRKFLQQKKLVRRNNSLK